jgi:hypothetical protein
MEVLGVKAERQAGAELLSTWCRTQLCYGAVKGWAHKET